MNRMLMPLSITVAALVVGTHADAADSAQQPSLLGNMTSAVQQQATQEQKAATDVIQSEKAKAQQAANHEQQKAKALAESQKATDTAQGHVGQATQKANAKTSEALGKRDSAINSILGK